MYIARQLNASLIFLAHAAPVSPKPRLYIKYFATQ
jgi:hypothetical protein